MADYTIKNLKVLVRSGAYEASLYHGSRRVAFLSDDGRGGQPRITWLDQDKQPIPNRLSDTYLADLTAWGEAHIPDDYFTGWWENYDRMSNNWEATLDYLVEVAEMNKIARKKDVFRRKDGNFYTKNPDAPLPADATHIWRENAWQPAA